MKNFQIKRILIPTDFSATGLLALEQGAYLAQASKAELHLFHVVEVPDYVFSVPDEAVRMDTEETIGKIMQDKMDQTANDIRTQYGVTVKTLNSVGRILTEVTDYVKENNIDLIVMGTHGAKGFDEYILGSNANRVVEHADCPVITVQTKPRKPGFSEIILPVDNLLHSRQKTDYAIELARLSKARIHILGLLETEDAVEEGKFNIKLDAVEKEVKDAGLTYVRKIERGNNLATTAMEYAQRVQGDLIVILKEEESRLSGRGLFAKQIVNHSKIPVMSIKPQEGYFESIDLTGNARIY
ncbi:MAG TPA: universal stress protein [Bacteroidia bacterium]|jgi:nucleotide-binding universal stress UspA family protein|nr:universal stress protein [Bacteroidia bacterium]